MHDDDDILSPVLGRRHILRTASALGIFGLAKLTGTAKLAGGRAPHAAAPPLDLSDLVDDPAMAAVCTLTPSETQGPYYLNLNLNRSDITEGLAGLPTRVHLQIVRASDCSPVPNAIVDLWHARPDGDYSGFANQGTQGQTFLRGIQTTDANGQAYFDTIYPGWYPGRTIHMHLKVRPTGESVLTTQLYFKQRLTTRIYQSLPPYVGHAQSTTNANDNLFLPETVMDVISATGSQLQVALTVAIA